MSISVTKQAALAARSESEYTGQHYSRAWNNWVYGARLKLDADIDDAIKDLDEAATMPDKIGTAAALHALTSLRAELLKLHTY